MRSSIKVGGAAVLFALLVSSALVWLLVVNAPSQQEPDSSQMKLVQERVRVTVKKRAQYELLKGMVGECPAFDSTHGEPWEFVINQWQRKQLEGTGAKVRLIAEIKPEEEEHQVEYRLEREIDLKADGVERIVFGPKEDKGSALSEVIVGVKNEDICIYNSDFALIGKMHLERPSFSKNLRYIGGLEFPEIPEAEWEKVTYKFELFDYTGKKLWELERELYYDASPNRYSISNNGLVIELDNSDGVFALYDQNGNKIKEMKLYAGQGDVEGQSIGAEFSQDGEYFLITAQDDYDHSFGEGIGVLFFTWDGRELWRSNTEEGAYGRASISKFGNYVIVSTRKTTYLFSQRGSLIKEYKNLFPTHISFSSDEKYFVITEYYHTAYLVRSEDGEMISKYGASKKSGSIYGSDIAAEAEAFGVLCSGTASLISFDGSTLWSADFPVPEGPLFRMLNLSLSDDGKQVVIQIGTKIMIYERVE